MRHCSLLQFFTPREHRRRQGCKARMVATPHAEDESRGSHKLRDRSRTRCLINPSTLPNELNTTLTPHSIRRCLLRLLQQNLGHPLVSKSAYTTLYRQPRSRSMTIRRAACSCGQLHLTIEGEPWRISMCHCLECQEACNFVFGIPSNREA